MQRTKLVYTLFFAYLLLSSFAAIQQFDSTADLEESDQSVPQGTDQFGQPGRDILSDNTDLSQKQKNQSVDSNEQIQTNTVQESSNIQYKENKVDYDTWYEGETVKINFNYPEIVGSKSELRFIHGTDSTNTFYGLSSTRNNDSSAFLIRTYDDNDDDYTQISYFIYFPVVSTGLFNASFYVDTDATSPTDYYSGTFELTNDNWDTYVTENNEILIEVGGGASDSFGAPGTSINIYEADGSVSTSFTGGPLINTGATPFAYFDIFIDLLTFTPDVISLNQRSEFKYGSYDQRLHRLKLTAYEKLELEIYAPLAWNLSSTNPLLDHTFDSVENTWNVTVERAVDIEVIFLSGTGWGMPAAQKQLLAISDVSSDYMHSPSFESGENEDFEWMDASSSNTGDSVNTSIVADGSFSLRLEEDTSSEYGDLVITTNLMDLPAGQYYISFSLFVESHTNTEFSILKRTSSGWDSTNYDLPETNRWETKFLYFAFDGTSDISNRQFIFRLISAGHTGVVFIDNFRIYQANGQFVSKGSVIAQGISVDGYRNPIVSNTEWQVEIGTRTDQTAMKTATVWSDENGMIRMPFDVNLNPEEHYLKIYSKENRFPIGDHIDFSLFSQQAGGSVTVDQNLLLLESSAGSDMNVRIALGSYDITDKDLIVMKIKSNVSDSTIRFIRALDNDPVFREADISLTTDYETHVIFPESTWTGSTDTDLEFYVDVISNTKLTIDTFIFTNDCGFVQCSYFTPLPSSAHSYSYEQNGLQSNIKNYWDFSESNEELEVKSLSQINTQSTSIENGKYIVEFNVTDDSLHSFYRFKLADNIDMSLYNSFVVRIKTNNTGGATMYLHDGASPIGSLENSVYSDFTIFEWNLSLETYIGELHFAYRVAPDFTGKYKFETDYFGLVDTWDQGFAWEFDEPNYQEGWTGISGATIEKKDHSLSLTKSGGDNFWGIRKNVERLDTSKADRLELIYKSTGDIDGINIAQYDLSSNYISNSEISEFELLSRSEWTYYSIDLSFDTDWDGDIHYNGLALNFLDTSSGGEIVLELSSIRFIDDDTSNDLEVDSTTGLAYFDNDNNSTEYYKTLINGSHYGTFSEYEIFYLPLQESKTYSFTYTKIYSDKNEEFAQIPTTIYEHEYTVTSDDISYVSIVNQEGDFIDPRQYRIEVDGSRIHSDTFIWDDVSSTKNLTISDFWGNILYQNTAENYSRFLDFQLTLYSVKIWNMQPSPVYIYITNGPVYSEWVMPGEIIEYNLMADSYNFTIVYSSDVEGFGAASTNGTTAEYVFNVNTDTALVVAGNTIQDVFSNVINLQQDLDSTNSTIHAVLNLFQTNVTLQIDATNSEINILANDLDIIDSSLEGNFTAIINTLNVLDSSLEGNFSIITDLLNIIDSDLEGNFTILTNLLNVMDSNLNGNFTILTNLLNVMDSNLDGNFTIITNLLNLMDSNLQGNFTLFINEFNALNTNLDGNFTIIVSTLNLLDSNLQGNFTIISDLITLVNSTITGNITLISSTLNILDSNLEGNFTIITNLLNILDSNLDGNFTLISSTLNILDSNLEGNFTIITNLLNILDSNLDGNFTVITDLLITLNTTFTGNISIVTDLLNVMDSNLAGNFTATLLQIDLTNATQVNLIINTFNLMLDTGVVHFDLVDLFGVGLDWTTVKVYVNDSRIYAADQSYTVGDFLNVTVETFFNSSVLTTNFTVSARFNQTQDVTLIIPIALQYFTNDNLVPIAVYVESGGYNTSFVIQKNETLAMWVIQGTYNISVDPLQNDFRLNSTHTGEYSGLSLSDYDLPNSKKKISFSMSMTASKIDGDADGVEGQIEDAALPGWVKDTIIFLLSFWAVAVSALVFLLVKSIALYFGMSTWNVTVGLVNGDWRLWRRRDFAVGRDKPEETSFTSGYTDKTLLDDRVNERIERTYRRNNK